LTLSRLAVLNNVANMILLGPLNSDIPLKRNILFKPETLFPLLRLRPTEREREREEKAL